MSLDDIKIEYDVFKDHKLGTEHIGIRYKLIYRLDEERLSMDSSFATTRRHSKKDSNNFLNTVNKWNNEIGTSREHSEIRSIRNILRSVYENFNGDLKRYHLSNAIKFHRLNLSELSLGKIYGHLSKVVLSHSKRNEEEVDEIDLKTSRKVSGFDFQELSPNWILSGKELKIWKELDSLINVTNTLRSYGKYNYKRKDRSHILNYPVTYAKIIDAAFDGVVNTVSSINNITAENSTILEEFRIDVDHFVPLYEQLIKFESENSKQFKDLSFYSYLNDEALRDKFKQKKTDSYYWNYLQEAFINHPLVKELDSYMFNVIPKLITEF